jgi:hypothetical protein
VREENGRQQHNLSTFLLLAAPTRSAYGRAGDTGSVWHKRVRCNSDRSMWSWASLLTFPAPAHILTAACGMIDAAILSLPHVWWHLHADGAPTFLRDLEAQVFSLVLTSASGERSFKQKFRVHSRICNRLSVGKVDMTLEIHLTNSRRSGLQKGLCSSPTAQRWRRRSCTLSITGKRRLRL